MNGVMLSSILQTSEWLNVGAPLTASDWRGKVVVLNAFQMFCPGCARYSLPQMERVYATFPRSQVVVIGLHTVFEHHSVMTSEALRVYIKENKIRMPIAIDTPSSSGVPRTMQALQLRGTPSTLLFDTEERLQFHHFGVVEDLMLGVRIATLLPANAAKPVGHSEVKA